MTPELEKVIEAAREATCDTHDIPACVELGKALYAYDKARGAICPVCDGAGSLPDSDSHPGEGPTCTGPCGGTGLVERGESIATNLEAYRVCATCGGEKMVGDGLLFRPCPTCG